MAWRVQPLSSSVFNETWKRFSNVADFLCRCSSTVPSKRNSHRSKSKQVNRKDWLAGHSEAMEQKHDLDIRLVKPVEGLNASSLYEMLTEERVTVDCQDLSIPDSAKKLYGRRAGSKLAFSGYLDPYLALDEWSSKYSPSTTSFALRIRTLGFVGRLEEIPNVLEKMELFGIKPNLEVYSALASAYSRVGDTHQVVNTLRTTVGDGYVLNDKFLCMLVTSLMKQGNVDSTLQLLVDRKYEDLTFQAPEESDALSNKSKQKKLADKPAPLKVAKFPNNFNEQLHHINSIHDIVIWTAFMKGLLDNRQYSRTLEVFDHLRLRGMEPDCVAYDVAIQACGYLRDMPRATEIFRSFPWEEEKTLNTAVYGSLLFCAASCGDVEAAEAFYNEALSHDIPMGYRGRFHLLQVYAKKGVYDRAVTVYEGLRYLPRTSLPSIYDWFCLFSSFKRGLQGYQEQVQMKPNNVTDIREEVCLLADRYFEEGLGLCTNARHLFGANEIYFDIRLLAGRFDEALTVLHNLGSNTELPLTVPKTRGSLYRAWARYIVEKGSTVSGVEEALQDMQKNGMERNEPSILAAICMFSELGYPGKALDLLRECAFQGFWLNIGKSVRRTAGEHSEHYLVASHAERLDALKRLRESACRHAPTLLPLLQSYIEQVGYQHEGKSSDSSTMTTVDARQQIVDALFH